MAEDSTLISGDVVQNKLAPHMMGSDCTAKAGSNYVASTVKQIYAKD